MTNIYKEASRKNVVFRTNKGVLNTTDLWNLSFADLDTLFKEIDAEITKTSGNSLLKTKSTNDDLLELKLNIVKDVFETKSAEKELSKKLKDKKAEKERLLEILNAKKESKLEELSEEDLIKRINALDE